MGRMKGEISYMLDRLKSIGFYRIGRWTLADGSLEFVSEKEVTGLNFLYAFVSSLEVLYVGKTASSITRRLYGYRNPGKTQFTNLYCKRQICKLLTEHKPVEVFVRGAQKPSHIGSFAINEAAALEDAIIRDIAPPWNRIGTSSKEGNE